MSLPNIPEFEKLLSSLTTVNPNRSDFSSITVTEEIVEKHSNGRVSKRASVLLWYRNEINLSCQALIKRLLSELKTIQHYATEPIAKTILLLFTIYRNKSQSSIEALNEILNSHSSCEVSQYFILPTASQNKFVPISFGEFIMENLDSRRFAYKCQKAGSDFFLLYGHDLVNKPSIERKRYDTIIINCHLLINKISIPLQHEFVALGLLYFESVSSALMDVFWEQFKDQQNLHISSGLPSFPDRYFREMLEAKYVTIFLKIPVNGVNRGYVVPTQIGNFTLTMPYDTGPSIKEFYTSIEKDYKFIGFESSEIHQTFKTFCKFVSKGYRYLDEGRLDEGFLHFIIALDLVFGDKNESTKSVGNRCAILSYKDIADFDIQKRKISELYDSRSKYVHAGLAVKKEHIDQVKEICKEVVFCFLRLQSYWKRQNKNFTIEQWKKKLDYTWSALEAGEIVNDNLKMEIGVKRYNH